MRNITKVIFKIATKADKRTGLIVHIKEHYRSSWMYTYGMKAIQMIKY
jgi:hypothetical protein